MGFNRAEGFGPYTFACIERDRDIDIEIDRLRKRKTARSILHRSILHFRRFRFRASYVVAISMSLLISQQTDYTSWTDVPVISPFFYSMLTWSIYRRSKEHGIDEDLSFEDAARMWL